MRVLFVVWPGDTHLFPVTPLAWALQSAGHEVRIGTHHALAESITSIGLTPIGLGDKDVLPMGPGKPYPEAEWERLERVTTALELGPDERDTWDIFTHYLLPGVWDFLPLGLGDDQPQPGVDDLVEFARDWQPDLVLWDPLYPAAAVAAAACGAAHARLSPWQDYCGWTLDRYNASAAALELGEHPLVAALRPAAARHGVEVNDELLYGQWTIDGLPPGFRLTTTARGVPLRLMQYAAPTAVPEWLRKPPDRPRVAVSLGLSQRTFMSEEDDGWSYLPAVMQALSELDVEVIATLNAVQLAGLGKLPANVRAVDYVPLNQLLPSCSALIHHGGPGSFTAGAAHQVPQLVMDSADASIAEKFPTCSATARYVIEQGAGLSLDLKKPSADSIRERISRVLEEPSFRAGAARVYNDLQAMPSPVDLVPTLERLTVEHRSR
ncbi:glycosyltransferase [Amycolatopsis marina]|uniref:Glycosyltransferase n=1 Tax=Amycolatopsis marina TaxID=490629 RepID=A0A1I0ZMV6_9PSEU|nr:nucleotide disphospho-sugar-binding domain-containing protein [Amycolatopsis marina]SFB25830.1 glycosyltransferase [Amycolatopsis marina]